MLAVKPGLVPKIMQVFPDQHPESRTNPTLQWAMSLVALPTNTTRCAYRHRPERTLRSAARSGKCARNGPPDELSSHFLADLVFWAFRHSMCGSWAEAGLVAACCGTRPTESKSTLQGGDRVVARVEGGLQVRAAISVAVEQNCAA